MSRKGPRRGPTIALLAGSLMAATAPAVAQYAPLIVMRGKSGAPVMMYGVDISGAVIEGEFGLARPGQVAPTIIMPYWRQYLWVAPRRYMPYWGRYSWAAPRRYFPSTGHRPRSGRLEVIPPANRLLPSPAEPFYREWHSPGPAMVPVPYDPPPVFVAPRIEGPSPLPIRPAPPNP